MKISTALGSIVCFVIITGCSSTLKTFDSKGKPSVGIPVSTPVLVKVTEKTNYEVDPKNKAHKEYCNPDINSSYKFMPLGERSYIAFDPAALGKGEFKIEFTDSGLMKTISLNSDATAGVENINNLLGTVLPYVAATKAAEVAPLKVIDGSAQENKDKYCIKKGTEVIDIEIVNISK